LPAEGAVLHEEQSRVYGERFAAVYDAVFPAATGRPTADFLLALSPLTGDRFVELGVGTGRVAVPLAQVGARVIGVDSSPEMLRKARENATRRQVTISLVQADIRAWASAAASAVAYCVCGTISMFATRQEQRAVLRNAASSVRPGGAVVLETHNPEHVRDMHAAAGHVEVTTALPGVSGGVCIRSALAPDSTRWRLQHSWEEGGGMRTESEFSTLTSPDVLERMAISVGLRPVVRHGGWDGSPLTVHSPTYVSVFAVEAR